MGRDRADAGRGLIAGLDATLVVELLLLGSIGGFLAGLLGVGGGMMMVPFLTFLLTNRGVPAGHAVKMAIATSMATIVFTSLSSVRAHHSRGFVRWDLVRHLAPGILVGGLAGAAGVFALLKGQTLALGFALFVGYSATRMLHSRPSAVVRRLPGPLGQAAVGAGIGFMSGLVGAGGAFMSVPFMSNRQVPIHQAVATSAALGFPIAFANVAGYVIGGWSIAPALPGAFGYLYLPALGVISLASVIMAPQGARAAHALDMNQLKRVFAALLYALGAYMFYKGLTG